MTAAPRIPQLAVCKGTAAPLEVEAGALPDAVAVPELLCAAPLASDSFAIRVPALPDKAVASTPVLFLHELGVLVVTLEENTISAHYYRSSVFRVS